MCSWDSLTAQRCTSAQISPEHDESCGVGPPRPGQVARCVCTLSRYIVHLTYYYYYVRRGIRQPAVATRMLGFAIAMYQRPASSMRLAEACAAPEHVPSQRTESNIILNAVHRYDADGVKWIVCWPLIKALSHHAFMYTILPGKR